MGTVILIVWFALICTCFVLLSKHAPKWVYSLVAGVWCAIWAVVSLFRGDSVGVALNVLVASYWINDFWKKKPPGMKKKATEAVGAKARAIRDKLVAAMPKASPVQVPVLVGA